MSKITFSLTLSFHLSFLLFTSNLKDFYCTFNIKFLINKIFKMFQENEVVSLNILKDILIIYINILLYIISCYYYVASIIKRDNIIRYLCVIRTSVTTCLYTYL